MGRSILVVDDDDAILDSLGDALRDEGYDVSLANNGLDALSHLEEHREAPPGLILLDLMMPVMDGLSFLEQCSANPSLPKVPVVVMSANMAITGSRHRKDVLLYMTKPLDLKRLLQTVEVWCS